MSLPELWGSFKKVKSKKRHSFGGGATLGVGTSQSRDNAVTPVDVQIFYIRLNFIPSDPCRKDLIAPGVSFCLCF